jgi:Mrp family chromosome partitioning ATPase
VAQLESLVQELAKNRGDVALPQPAAKRAAWSYPTHVTSELAVMVSPASKMAERLISVTSQLQHMHVDLGTRSFCFIGDDKKVGTTVVAANVAAAFAMSGQRTILVEANLRAPRIGSMFGIDRAKPGLSEWMAGLGDVQSWAGYMQPAYPNLMVMTAGNALKEGEAFLATELRGLILEMSRMFDVVICDCAPMSDVSGTLAVVTAVERTVIVARANKTRLKALIGFQDVVKNCGGVIGGSVLLDF